MKNHFYISYMGNKRQEVEQIYNSIDFKDITTIIEPFCGTSAMSYFISTKKEGLKYILNDNNQYLKEMFEIFKDDEKIKQFENKINDEILPNIQTKDNYDNFLKSNKNLYGWFISSKYYKIRPGIFPQKRKFNKIDLKRYPIYDFYKNSNIEFYNLDGIEIYEKYKNNKNNLILLDPPYLQACNDYYADSKVNIYEYLYNDNPIEKEKAQILLILENIWIIKLLFKNNKILVEYDKNYFGYKKRKTTHIIITNLK